jgi:hypothetical protein
MNAPPADRKIKVTPRTQAPLGRAHPQACASQDDTRRGLDEPPAPLLIDVKQDALCIE